MSNYVTGFFYAEDENAVAVITDAIHNSSMVGFHIVPVSEIPDVKGFPKTNDRVYFYLSDNNDVLYAEILIYPGDWAEGYSKNLPWKLGDRVALIVDAVRMIVQLSYSPVVGLWASEVDQLEGITQVPLELLFATLSADFDRVGIPCILYEVIP